MLAARTGPTPPRFRQCRAGVKSVETGWIRLSALGTPRSHPATCSRPPAWRHGQAERRRVYLQKKTDGRRGGEFIWNHEGSRRFLTRRDQQAVALRQLDTSLLSSPRGALTPPLGPTHPNACLSGRRCKARPGGVSSKALTQGSPQRANSHTRYRSTRFLHSLPRPVRAC